jgi:hypothetical protein
MTREYYPSPEVVVAGVMELMQNLRRVIVAFFAVPATAQGGFLQPPAESHFGHE